MSWITKFFSSSIGQKVIVAATGIFLMLFLVVHLLGNFQLLKSDGGEAFNTYAYFMTHNPLIKTISYSLYAFILIHAFKGLHLWWQNRQAAGVSRYAVNHSRASESSARNMAWFGIVIFIFLLIHLWQFWLQMKMGVLPKLTNLKGYEGIEIQNLYLPVAEAFQNKFYVGFYVLSMVVVGLHLWHGFWSSLQTLGINHRKYNAILNFIGGAYAVLISLGFAIIPIWMFLKG